MVYTNLKSTAVKLRKEGLSYSEIKERVPVSKSTLANWFKDIKLSPVQRFRLKKKRKEAARRGSEKKSARVRQVIEEIKNNSGKDIGKISRRELWLVGIILYWKNGNKKDLKKGVHFSSSDPQMIKLFLKWLQDVGGLRKEEINFDIFMAGQAGDKREEAKSYWSEVTGFPQKCFWHVYFYKQGKSDNGFLRVRVRASSMLARQINGWIEALKNFSNEI